MNNTDQEKVVIITGASSGIGEAAARCLARKGMRVALAARREDRLEDLAAEINAAGGEALPVPTDVCKWESIREMVRTTRERWGKIDVLINNAGLDNPCPVVFLEDEKIRAQVDVNLVGTIECTRAVLPHLLRQRSGHIINISSIAGLIGIPWSSVYSATKFAVNGFSDSLRREVRRHGVRVTVLNLGYVATPLIPSLAKIAEGAPDAQRLPGLMTVDYVAEQIAGIIRRPRSHVIRPWWWWWWVTGERISPDIADLIVHLFLPKQGK